MGPQDVIAMAMEIVLERERQRKWLMEESLRAHQFAFQEKVREHSMLKRKKQGILAKKAAEEKLVDNFMVFLGAIENNDLKNAQKFDEKEMKNDILQMMDSDSGEDGGFSGRYGDKNVLGIDLGPEQNAMKDAIEALMSNKASCDGDNGGLPGGHGGINNAVENANNLGEDAVVTPTEGTKSGGGDGSKAAIAGGDDGGDRSN